MHFGEVSPEPAKVMVASVREHMPEVKICQLTDERSKALDFVDEVRRSNKRGYFNLLIDHLRRVPEPYIRLDYDMVLQDDISHILDGEQDFAVNLHGDARMKKHPFGMQFPYAACVFAANSRSASFADDLEAHHRMSERDDWMGLVASANEVILSGKYNIRSLSGEIYNYSPRQAEGIPILALVLHYKGERKHLMVPSHAVAAVRKDEKRVIRMVRHGRA